MGGCGLTKAAKERRRKLDALVARGNFAELSPPHNIASPHRMTLPRRVAPNDAGSEDYDHDGDDDPDYRMPLSSELPRQQDHRSDMSADVDPLGPEDVQVDVGLYNMPQCSTTVERAHPASAGQQEDKSTITAYHQPRNETEPLYTAPPTHSAYAHAEHALGATEHTDSLIEAHRNDDGLQQVDRARVSVSPARSFAPTQRSILLSPSSSLEHVDTGNPYTHYERAYKRSRLAADTAWEQEVRERAGGSMSPWVGVGSAMTCQAETPTPAPAQAVSFDGALEYKYQDEADVALEHGEESYERSGGVGGAVYKVDRDWNEEYHLRGRKEAEAVDEEGGDHQIHQYDWPSQLLTTHPLRSRAACLKIQIPL